LNPGKNTLRIWKNIALDEVRKKNHIQKLSRIVLIYFKSFVALDKAQSKEKKGSKALGIKKAYEEFLQECQKIFHSKDQCELVIFMSSDVLLYIPLFKMMPEHELILEEELPDCISCMKDRPFGILRSDSPIVKINNWKPGDLIRIVSFVDRIQPYVKISRIKAVKCLYRKNFQTTEEGDKEKKKQ